MMKLLGTKKQVLMIMVIIAVYGLCFFLTFTHDLANLNDIHINDFFVQDSINTQKYFVELKTKEAFDTYKKYIATNWGYSKDYDTQIS